MKISWNFHVIYMGFDYKLNLSMTYFDCRQMTGNWHEIPIEKRLSLSNRNYFYDFVGQCNANDIAFAFHFDEIWRTKQTLLESLFYPMEGHGISMEIVVTFFPGKVSFLKEITIWTVFLWEFTFWQGFKINTKFKF